MFNKPAEEITRTFYFNVGGPEGFMRWGIYLFMFIAVGYLVFTLIKKIKIWKLGKPELRTDHIHRRLLAVVKYVFLQTKILKESYAGIMHAAFFFGFLVLFIVTTIILIQEDFTGLFFNYHFIHGNFYIIWSLAADIFGAVVLFGLVMAFYRRYIVKPSRLDTQKTDTMALLLILFIVITGFANEAMRIAITRFPVMEFPDFEKIASPIGYALAVPISLIGKKTLGKIHYINWWVHMLAAFTFIGLIGSNKLGHIAISFLNIFFGNLDNEKATAKYSLKVIDPAEFETAESFGVAKVEDYTWKQLMDSDACTRCGRCQDNCPTWLTEKPLSPKKLVIDIKTNMYERLPQLFTAQDPSSVTSTPLLGGSVQDDEFWSCTNCSACMEACPVNIEHVQKMLDMRRYKVLMEGSMRSELHTTFTNLENNFNPYGFAFAERGVWAKDLGVKTLAEDPSVDYLYFTGSAAAYDKRNQKVATAFIKILQKAGIKIGILGPEEADSGDAALRAGNEYLFQMLAAQNLETFKSYNVKKIICTCPHDYNTLKKEYKQFAAMGKDSSEQPLEYAIEVYHHTEIIAELIKTESIKLTGPYNERVTYHDSCFLGRYNEIYEGPRFILQSIPGLHYVEMSRHHSKSFCCGGGGARMFMEENLGTRINHFRTKDAEASGAGKIATACPFCMTMLSDGITELAIKNLETLDIAELVYNSMEK